MRVLLLTVALFITYGSFYPFEYVAHVATRADLTRLFATMPTHIGLIDAIGNVLLFVPYGLLVPATRSRREQLVMLVAGVVLAWAIQYVQFWFPSRDPNGVDALFNTLGLLLGLGGGVASRGLIQRQRDGQRDLPPYWPVVTGLMALWIIYRWFPLVPAPDLQNFKNGFKPLLDTGSWEVLRVMHDMAAWLTFFRLARYSLINHWSASRLTVVAIGVVLFEPVFANNLISWSNVFGLLLALVCRPFFVRGKFSLLLLILLQLSSLVLGALTPFQVYPGRDLLWLPFSGMLEGDMLRNLNVLIEKTFIYGSLIFMLGYYGIRISVATAMMVAVLFVLEWLQQWLPGHVPEITDAFLAAVLGLGIRHFLAISIPALKRGGG